MCGVSIIFATDLLMSHDVSYCLSVSFCLITSHGVSLSHSVSYCLMMSHNVSCCLLLIVAVSHAVSYRQKLEWRVRMRLGKQATHKLYQNRIVTHTVTHLSYFCKSFRCRKQLCDPLGNSVMWESKFTARVPSLWLTPVCIA